MCQISFMALELFIVFTHAMLGATPRIELQQSNLCKVNQIF